MAADRQQPHGSGRVVSVRMDEDMIRRLDALSAHTNRSRGFYLRLAMQATLPQLEREYWHHFATKFEEKVIEKSFHALMLQLTNVDSDDSENPDAPPALFD